MAVASSYQFFAVGSAGVEAASPVAPAVSVTVTPGALPTSLTGQLSRTETGALWWYAAVEFLAMACVLLVHTVRALLGHRYSAVHGARVAVAVSRFSGMEMLRLWNRRHLFCYLRATHSVVVVRRYRRDDLLELATFLTLQLAGLLLAVSAPVNFYLRCKRAALPGTASELVSAQSLSTAVFMVQVLSLFAEQRCATQPWTVLFKHCALNGVHTCPSGRWTVAERRWKREWDSALVQQCGKLRASLLVLCGRDSGVAVLDALQSC